MSFPSNPTTLPGGLKKLIWAWEILRERDLWGYGSDKFDYPNRPKDPHSNNSFLIVTDPIWSACGKKLTKRTVCSSFTAQALAIAFDPREPEALAALGPQDAFKPVFFDGKSIGVDFCHLHNANSGADKTKGSVGSCIAYGLATEVKPTEMRRGDILGISWGNGHGHAAFCWDVHLDANDKVDCFQFIAANGMQYENAPDVGPGITICSSRVNLDVSQDVDAVGKPVGVYKRKSSVAKMFADALDGKEHPEYVTGAPWYMIPKLNSNIKKDDFLDGLDGAAAGSRHITTIGQNDTPVYCVADVRVARFNGVTPPAPYASKRKGNGAPPSIESPPPAQVPQHKADDKEHVEKLDHPEVKQPDDKPTPEQVDAEHALKDLYDDCWIDDDPGDPKSINDPSTQKALKDFQKRFNLDANGKLDQKTKDKLAKVMKYHQDRNEAVHLLTELREAKQFDLDPGDPHIPRNKKCDDAIRKFQEQNHLDVDGITGPQTMGALRKAAAGLANKAPAPKDVAPLQPAQIKDDPAVRQKIVTAAQGEAALKIVEDPPNSKQDKGGRITAYFQEGLQKTPQNDAEHRNYCAAFCAWVWRKAGAELPAGYDEWVPNCQKAFAKAGRFMPPNAVPQPGDVAFMTGSGYDYGHICIVETVENGQVKTTIEGNTWVVQDQWGVMQRDARNDHFKRITGFGRAVAPGAVAQAKPPDQPAQPKPGDPVHVWSTNQAKPGETVALFVHHDGIDEKTPTLPVVLFVGGFPQLATDGDPAQEAHPGFVKRFIKVPAVAAGTPIWAGIALGDGSSVFTPDALEVLAGAPAPLHEEQQPAPQPGNCECCKTLQKFIDAGNIEQKIFQRTRKAHGDKEGITALQKHLVQFGYDLGGSGADGDYGDTTMKVLSFFFIELGKGFLKRRALHKEEAQVIMQKCQAGFKTKNVASAPPAQGPSADMVYSSRIKVDGKPFPEWFNNTFQPQYPAEEDFGSKIYAGNFATVFDRIADMSGSAATPLNQFIALFCVFYNEQGGTFLPLPEEPATIVKPADGNPRSVGGLPYCFFGDSSKASYNKPDNRTVQAGDALKAKGLISSADDVHRWNGPHSANDEFPYDAPANVLAAAKECDFYKFSGNGLSQITWREAYQKYVNPALRDAGYKSIDDLTSDELFQAFTDPAVYTRAVHHEWHDSTQIAPNFAAVKTDPSKFFDIGWHIGGSKKYGNKYAARCKKLRDALLAAKVECT